MIVSVSLTVGNIPTLELTETYAIVQFPGLMIEIPRPAFKMLVLQLLLGAARQGMNFSTGN